MHEVVLSARKQKLNGVKALDIAKRLLDYGFHAPTMYFPLIVEEALMIEPTETESKESIDAFIDAMKAIAKEAEGNPSLVQQSPHTTPISRLDEAKAARQPNLRWSAHKKNSDGSEPRFDVLRPQRLAAQPFAPAQLSRRVADHGRD